jgi:hypothetical protein
LGAYATKNQYSVGTLKQQLNKRKLLINKLQAQITIVEVTTKNEVNKYFEQARSTDQQEIKQLKSNLEKMH